MAVIRTRKDSDPSGTVPSGTVPPKPDGESTPAAPPDRTRSVVKSPAPVQRQPRQPGRAVMPGGASQASSNESRSFVQDTLTELKRVIWPSQEDVRAGTIVTIGLLVFFSMYIFGLDFLAEQFFKMLGFYN